MKLGLSLGYAPPGTNPADLLPLVEDAERLGFDSVWVAEAWGTDGMYRASMYMRPGAIWSMEPAPK